MGDWYIVMFIGEVLQLNRFGGVHSDVGVVVRVTPYARGGSLGDRIGNGGRGILSMERSGTNVGSDRRGWGVKGLERGYADRTLK